MQTTAIQVNLGMISLNETEVTKKLAAWAAIIAVPTMIAGIYGMNFKNMPELDWALRLSASLAMMVVDRRRPLLRFKKTLAVSRSAPITPVPATPVPRQRRTTHAL